MGLLLLGGSCEGEGAVKPYLLLDVDGVLCPFPGFDMRKVLDPEYPGFDYYQPEHIHFARQTNGARIRRLMKSCDVIWCTGWGEGANEVISPLHDLPSFPVVPIPDETLDGIHWKQEAIEAYVPTGMPYAFVDDDIDDRGVLYGASRQSAPSLWLPVKCHEGITDTHVEALEGFAVVCDAYFRRVLS